MARQCAERQIATALVLAIAAVAKASGQAWGAAPVESAPLLLALATQIDTQSGAKAAGGRARAYAIPVLETGKADKDRIKLETRLSQVSLEQVSAVGAAAKLDSLPEAEEPAAKRKYRFVLPPIRLWGDAAYDIRREGGDNQQPLVGQYLSLQMNAATFIWQPWFAQLTGGLGLGVSSTEGQNSSGSNTLSGNGRLMLLPMSRFPFETFYERTDSRAEASLLGTQFVTTRYGMSQRYIPLGGGSNYLFSYDHASQERESGIADNYDGLQFDATLLKGLHNYDVNARIARNQSSDKTLDSSYEGVSVRHAYHPDARLSIENLGNINQTSIQTGATDIRSRFAQLNSFASWRPEGDKWFISGGARIFDLSTEGQGDGNLTISGNVGANYEWSRHVRLSGGAAVTQTQSAQEARLSSSQNAGISYRPDLIALGPYNYNWFASASASNRTGSDDSGQRLSTQIGHSVDRRFDLGPGSALSANVAQNFSADRDTVYDAVNRVGHNAALSWNLGNGGGTAYLRLSGGDARALGGKKDIFQSINFQASLNRVQGRRSSWTGNVTVQATRQLTEEVPEKDFDITTSGDVTYETRRLFDVPRLSFISQLRLNNNQYAKLNTGALKPLSRDLETQSWDNRIAYTIGRTAIYLTGRLSIVNGQARDLLQVKFIRQFGDL